MDDRLYDGTTRKTAGGRADTNIVNALSLKRVIENASPNQLAPVEYNQHEINIILAQLLIINFVSENEKEIENDLKSIDSNSLEQYWQNKLLSLSPIRFLRKNCFIEYKII